jgi:cytochrome P450
MPTEPLSWDPFDESLKVDPHHSWARLRAEAPVYRNERFDFWALSKFDDVDAALREPYVYSSAHGTVLELMTDERQSGHLMIFVDPPDHTFLRRLVSKAFTPRRVALLEDSIRALCVRLLDAGRDLDQFDLVTDFGGIIPGEVIATLLGVPEGDRAEIRATIDRSFHLDPEHGMLNDTAVEAWGELHAYCAAQLADRQVHPRDDLLGDLLAAEYTDERGEVHRLGPDGAATFALLLISAGTETTARLIGWAGWLFDRHPAQRALVAADPERIPAALEEVLRYEAPSPVQARWTTEEVTVRGTVIPADSKVLLLNGSADRDEDHFVDADRFDVERRFDHHLAFGYGAHFCLGAALARLEARVAFEALLARHPSWAVDEGGTELRHTSTVRGFEHLPVTLG